MKNFDALENKLGVSFKNKKLLQNAFVHRSYLNEHKDFDLPSNEKLEFLGDSVLSLITSYYLYQKYPTLHEGQYTDIKASIVKTESLYEAAKRLLLGDYLYLSRGEIENKGKDNKSILADCFEAIIGALFLDNGFSAANEFVIEFLFSSDLDSIVTNNLYLSSKNKLQEYLQDKYKQLPIYKVLSEVGPEHNKLYTVGVYFENKLLAQATGHSKKQAQDAAAAIALLNPMV